MLTRPWTSTRPEFGGRIPATVAHQRGLAGAVGADDAEHLALGDLEGDVLERLDLAHDPLAPAELEHACS